MRILLIEDEVKLVQAIQQSLAALGYEVISTESGEEGYYLASNEAFELIILDLNLPGRDGIEILSSLRSQGCALPVLILTARDGVDDRVVGLDSGADDYLVKPFAFPELHARLRALLRRGRPEAEGKLCCADLELDRLSRTATRAGQALELTPKEFELLEFLLLNKGHVVTREMLGREIWGERSRVVPLDNVIDVHMTRLRAKVDAPFTTPVIRTVRGVGFMAQSRT